MTTTLIARIPRRDLWILAFKLALLGGLIAFRLTKPQLWRPDDIAGRALSVGLFLVSAHLVLEFIRVVMALIYRHRRKIPGSQRDLYLVALRNISSGITFVLIVTSLLSVVGFAINQILLSIGLIASGLAIAFKEYINNVVSGLMMVFSGEYSIGDWVSVGGVSGVLTDMTMQHTHLVDRYGRHLYLPNHEIFDATIENHSRRKYFEVEVDFTRPKAGLDLEALQAKLIAAIPQRPDAPIQAGSHRLDILSINSEKVTFRFRFKLLVPNPLLAEEIAQPIYRAALQSY